MKNIEGLPEDTRAIQERYRGWANDLVKQDLQENNNGFSVLMMQLAHDFNIGTVVRNGNSFGMKNFFYYGPKKKWDRRSSIGTYLYSVIDHLKEFDQIIALKEKYCFVALEQSDKSVPINTFDWNICGDKEPLIIIGEEGCGLSEEMLAICDHVIEIPSFGSVRSLNAGCASSIAMYDYIAKQKL